MLTIEDIAIKDVKELVVYRQPAPNYTRITILRGDDFYARCVNGDLQEWTAGDTDDHARKRYAEAILFEEKLGSELD